MKHISSYNLLHAALFLMTIFFCGCNNDNRRQENRSTGGTPSSNFNSRHSSPIISDGEREHPIPAEQQEYHASRGVSTLEEAYLAGYDDGYEDGEEDGATGVDYGISFDPASGFTGEFKRSYTDGYEDGYHDGYHTNYKIFLSDMDEEDEE